MNYVLFFALYVCLGFVVFEVFRRWHAFLVRLAERHDLPTRRKIAARCYLPVALLMLVGLWGVVLVSVTLLHRLSALIPVALVGALLPAAVWWWRRLETLTELGYFRQKNRG